MEKKDKNDEILSRRGFFKDAAKKALPILGAVALASMPIMTKAAETSTTGCNYGCSGGCTGCYGTCTGTCSGTCEGTCKTTCYNQCYNACKDTCKGTCQGITKY